MARRRPGRSARSHSLDEPGATHELGHSPIRRKQTSRDSAPAGHSQSLRDPQAQEGSGRKRNGE
eukprot:12880768-Prorocentrum_lima.AAC.1